MLIHRYYYNSRIVYKLEVHFHNIFISNILTPYHYTFHIVPSMYRILRNPLFSITGAPIICLSVNMFVVSSCLMKKNAVECMLSIGDVVLLSKKKKKAIECHYFRCRFFYIFKLLYIFLFSVLCLWLFFVCEYFVSMGVCVFKFAGQYSRLK